MISDTIRQLEERLRTNLSLTSAQREEIQRLLQQLKIETANLPPIKAGHSHDDNLVRRLQESVTGFETSHPQVTALVNQISAVLANMGI